MVEQDVVISTEVVDATIERFTRLDASANERTMGKLARRLGKEQPSLLKYAAAIHADHGPDIGEAAMFYCTLVWAIFERRFARNLPRLTSENLDAAKEIVEQARSEEDGLADKPVHQRYAQALSERQPFLYAKIEELVEEDVREQAMTEECADIISEPTQVIIEAFDAALEGRRPGERMGPLVRETPKVGRNEKCPCGSGKKYKKCHGRA